MRQITVSLDVFAAIWGARQPEERDEDSILRRLLGVVKAETPLRPKLPVGFSDPAHGVVMPEGLQLHRTHKRTHYVAVASGGFLCMRGMMYPSLNQLSRAVTSVPENAWVSWNFTDEHGKWRRIDELRKGYLQKEGDRQDRLRAAETAAREDALPA